MAASVGDNLTRIIRRDGLGLETLVGVVSLGATLAPVEGRLEIENQQEEKTSTRHWNYPLLTSHFETIFMSLFTSAYFPLEIVPTYKS